MIRWASSTQAAPFGMTEACRVGARLRCPGLRGVAGDDANVSLGFPRQAPTACKPCFDAPWARIVGRSGKTQVAAEGRAQFAQIACRLRAAPAEVRTDQQAPGRRRSWA